MGFIKSSFSRKDRSWEFKNSPPQCQVPPRNSRPMVPTIIPQQFQALFFGTIFGVVNVALGGVGPLSSHVSFVWISYPIFSPLRIMVWTLKFPCSFEESQVSPKEKLPASKKGIYEPPSSTLQFPEETPR